MAIWLGIAIDGIPESLVIGTLAIGPEGMSLAFIVGVFLANLPEAMSSAVSMRKNGMSRRRILTMWGSLCLLTGVGAWLGAVMFPPEPQGYVFFIKLAIEALAAGAMLTMIAETMLPEAFEEGGSIIGFATLCGFLAALAVASV
jgi:zinc transporter ZupT